MPKRQLSNHFAETGESRRDFCARTGISLSYLCRLLAGDRVPSLAVGLRIAEAAGIPVESLLSSSPDNPTAAA